MTPPRIKCREQHCHPIVRTTDPIANRFLSFLFQKTQGIRLQLQDLLAFLLCTNDLNVSSLGQCRICPGEHGTWHSPEQGRVQQSLTEQWEGLRSHPVSASSQAVLVASFSQHTTLERQSAAPTALLTGSSSF